MTQLSWALLALGFLSSQPPRGHNWVSDIPHKARVLYVESKCFVSVLRGDFPVFPILHFKPAKAEMFCKSSWIAPVWCTHSMQTVFSHFFLQSPAPKVVSFVTGEIGAGHGKSDRTEIIPDVVSIEWWSPMLCRGWNWASGRNKEMISQVVLAPKK